MYFSNSIVNYYEIIHYIYDFIYRHGEGIIRTDKIYDFKNKRLLDTNFYNINREVEICCQNRGLAKECHKEKTLIDNEQIRIFVDTEGYYEKLREVAFWVFDIGKEKVIKKMDSNDSTIHNVIRELNKWVKKDCIIYAHHADHDVKRILENHGFQYRPYTKFCCTSSNTQYTDLDTLCANLGIIVNMEKRHSAVYDAKLLLDCFRKKQKLFNFIKYYKN
jgi:hypothetical protein|tara:strand:+ start:268 stop:924 length:657 start_codon:yes stop_codon:yes gene_type:complete